MLFLTQNHINGEIFSILQLKIILLAQWHRMGCEYPGQEKDCSPSSPQNVLTSNNNGFREKVQQL